MKLYECVFIARQDISQAQLDEITNNLKSLIKKFKGKVHKEENWGLRNLSYRIKKNRKGHYVLLNLEINSEGLFELERIMRLNEDILRFLMIVIDEINDEPSIIFQNKSDKQTKYENNDTMNFSSNIKNQNKVNNETTNKT